MLSFAGSAALWLIVFFSFLQILFSKKIDQLKLVNLSVKGQLIFSLISFFILIYAYITSDFSILNVFQNSHTTKPLIYKISAVWGNHEGSMLLWMLILTLFNYTTIYIYIFILTKFIFFIYDSFSSKFHLKIDFFKY